MIGVTRTIIGVDRTCSSGIWHTVLLFRRVMSLPDRCRVAVHQAHFMQGRATAREE